MLFRRILLIGIYMNTVRQILCDEHTQGKVSAYQINNKKLNHAVSDKFLSFTVDPFTIIHMSDCQLSNATFMILKTLQPAYLRIGGSDSSRLVFKGLSDGRLTTADLSTNSGLASKSKNLIFTGSQWKKFYDFVSKTGLNLIVCLSNDIFHEKSDGNLNNALEFITFSNKNNFDINWQLGYELQKIMSQDDGKEAGEDVTRLRKVLEVFPRYQNSLILGPDVTDLDTRDNILFIRNYLTEAQNSLSALTVHPDFLSYQDKENLHDELWNIFSKMDSLLWIKEGVLKSISRGVVPKKPVWIAESESKDAVCKFSDTITMIKRLGHAAKFGASVYLRKPHLLSLYEPTSEYWASSLFKALVGRFILDMKLTSGNNSSIHSFSHCTHVSDKPEEIIINPAAALAYEQGAITVYGVNTGTEPARLSFRLGTKTEETVHLYVLTEEAKNGLTNTLLNRQRLSFSEENELPMLTPRIRESPKFIVVPPQSIFFFVFPNVKSRVCLSSPMDDSLSPDPTKQKTKLAAVEEEKLIARSGQLVGNLPEDYSDPEDDAAVYVSYPKKTDRLKAARERIPLIRNENFGDVKQKLEPKSNIQIGPKFITFSDDTWLSSFPEKLKEIEEQPYLDDGTLNSQIAEDKLSKIEKYRMMAEAILGKRNVTGRLDSNFGQHSEDEEDVEEIKRIRRKINVAKNPSRWFISRQRRHADEYEPADNFKTDSDRIKIVVDNITQSEDLNSDHSYVTRHATFLNASDSVINSSLVIQPELETEPSSLIFRHNRETDDEIANSNPNPRSASDLRESLNFPIMMGPVVSPFSKKLKTISGIKLKTAKEKQAANRVVDGSQSEPNTTSSNSDISAVNGSGSHPEENVKSLTSTMGDASNHRAKNQSISILSEVFVANQMNSSTDGAGKHEDLKLVENSYNPAMRDANTNSGKNFQSKTESPILARDAEENKQGTVSRPALISTRKANNRNRGTVHSDSRTKTNALKSNSRNDPSIDPSRKFKPERKVPPTSTKELLELYRHKIQELLNLHLTKLEEVGKKLQEKSTKTKKLVDRNARVSRSKRETIISRGVHDESLNSNSGCSSNRINGVVSLSNLKQQKPVLTNRRNSSLTLVKAKPTPEKNPPNRMPREGVHEKRIHMSYQQTTPKTLTTDSKTKYVTKPRAASSKKHLINKRSFLDDVYSQTKIMCSQLSTNVKKTLGPAEKWVEGRVDDVKKEFDQLRKKRDLQKLKERFRERKEEMGEKLQSRLRKNYSIRPRDILSPQKSSPKLTNHANAIHKTNSEFYTSSTTNRTKGTEKNENGIFTSHKKYKREIKEENNTFILNDSENMTSPSPSASNESTYHRKNENYFKDAQFAGNHTSHSNSSMQKNEREFLTQDGNVTFQEKEKSENLTETTTVHPAQDDNENENFLVKFFHKTFQMITSLFR